MSSPQYSDGVSCSGGYSQAARLHIPVPRPHRRCLHPQVRPRQCGSTGKTFVFLPSVLYKTYGIVIYIQYGVLLHMTNGIPIIIRMIVLVKQYSEQDPSCS